VVGADRQGGRDAAGHHPHAGPARRAEEPARLPRRQGGGAVTTGGSPDDDPGMIERLDAGEPPSSPEEAEARAPYERLLARIRDLDDIAPPAGWEDRAVARWAGARRKRRLVIGLGAVAAAAAALAAVLLLRPCAAPAPTPTPTELEVAVLHAPGSTRRGDA